MHPLNQWGFLAVVCTVVDAIRQQVKDGWEIVFGLDHQAQ